MLLSSTRRSLLAALAGILIVLGLPLAAHAQKKESIRFDQPVWQGRHVGACWSVAGCTKARADRYCQLMRYQREEATAIKYFPTTVDLVENKFCGPPDKCVGLDWVVCVRNVSPEGEYPSLDGIWYREGDPTRSAIVQQRAGGVISFTNENRLGSRGHFVDRNTVVADDWQGGLRGTLSPDGTRISWANGTSWQRNLPGLMGGPDISGTWYREAMRNLPTQVRRAGGSLTFVNERGESSSGHFVDAATVIADQWQGGLRGTLSADHTRISWANGSSWSRETSPGNWQAVGPGDCTGNDVDRSGGPNPADEKCTPQFFGMTAVCWSNWCTYKNVPAERCTGGANPGRLFKCGR